MRQAIVSITWVAVLTMAALLPGCAAAGPRGLVTEEKEFTDFTYVDVEGTFEVEIIQSDSFSIIISADASFFDYVAVDQERETLRIYLNPRHTFTDFTLQARTLKATITMPALYGLRLSGASKGTISGFQSSQDFDLDVSVASSLKIADIEAGNTEFNVSGASQITGDVKTGDAKFEVSGASKIELEGSANKIMLNASGASKVTLANFPLDDANVNLSGASEATLNIKGRLDAVLIAAARLYFQGNPVMGDINVSGASTVKHK